MRLIAALLMMIASLAAVAAELPDTARVMAGYTSAAEARRLMGDSHQDELEGLWNYPEEGMVVAIVKTADFNYSIIAVESDNEAVDRGTVIGHLTTTASKKKMHMWLYSILNLENDYLLAPEKCVAETHDGTILIKKRKLKMHVAVNLTRFLPSVFGGVRVYPHVESTPVEPGLHKIVDSRQALPLIF